jgi:alpha-2-macroglobulin
MSRSLIGILILLLFGLCSGQATALEFKSSEEDGGARLPTQCLVFDTTLDAGKITVSDYISVRPTADLAVTTRGRALCLSGLEPGIDYQVTVRAGLPAVDGSTLTQAVQHDIRMADRKPFVRFSGNGLFLPRSAAAGLAVETINTPRLTVNVYRASDRLLPRLQLSQDPSFWEASRSKREDATLVWSGTLETAGPLNQRVQTAFPLATALPERSPGAYLVIIRDARSANAPEADDSWYESAASDSAARWIIETDLALSAVSGQDGMTIVARSLTDAEPVAGVRLQLIAQDNAILGEVTTDSDGAGRFTAGLLRGRDGSRPTMVMAYGPTGFLDSPKAVDFTMLDLRRPAFDFSDRGVTGRDNPGPVDSYVYLDRGIYRPGETVQASVLIRDRDLKALGDAPATLLVRRPDGVEYRRLPLTLNLGAASVAIPLSSAARHGTWNLDVIVGDEKKPVGKGRFEVDDFVPQRLKVSLTAPEAPVLPVETPTTMGAEARFLYGAVAANLTVEATVDLGADPNPFPEWVGYHFGQGEAPVLSQQISGQATMTDGEGRSTVSFTLPAADPAVMAPLQATITVQVLEPGGRATGRSLAVPVRPRNSYLGIRPLFGEDGLGDGATAAFDIIALDGAGKPLNPPGLRYVLYRVERDYTWFRSDGGWQWRVNEYLQPVSSGALAAKNAGEPVRFEQTLRWGTYRLRVDDGLSTAQYAFNAGWYNAAGSGDSPDKVKLALAQPRYSAEETAILRVEPPFAGEMEVVIANDRIHSRQTRTVGADPVEVRIPVQKAWGAGAYALVSFHRGVEQAKGPRPVRAVGLVWIGVDPAPRTLAVAIEAPERLQPRQSLTVPVRIGNLKQGETAFVTLAAVDEGILQLTDFKSPDPLAHFFAQRRLAVDLRDDYGRLLDGNAGPAGTIRQGGDGGIGGAALPVVPTKSVALFSGPVKVDREGVAQVTLDVPDFAGSLRLMAVAWSADRIGHAERSMTVRDSLVAELILPRFLAPGDEALATLQLHNVDGAVGERQILVSATPPLNAVAPDDGTGGRDYATMVTLPAGGRIELPVRLRATDVGIATVSLTVTGPDGEAVERSWPIAIRPSHAPVTLVDFAEQAAGAEFTLPRNLEAPFLPGSVSVAVNYSRLPDIDVPGLLNALDLYPYGCTEQTVSRALPLLAFPDLIDGLDLDRKAAADLRIGNAIDKILERQRADGSVGLWSSHDDLAEPWLQMYVFDFLLRASAAGHTVPAASLKAMNGWVGSHVTAGLNDSRSFSDRIAYGLLLLSRSGDVRVGDLRYMHDVGSREFSQSPLPWAQLGAALTALGDRRRAGEAFAKARAAVGGRSLDYYATGLRDAAGTLAVAAEAGDTATVAAALRYLQLELQSWSAWTRPTQEKAALLMAAQAMIVRTGPLTLAVNGIQPAAGGAVSRFSLSQQQLESGFSVVNQGTSPVYRTTVLHGVPRAAPSPVAKGIRLTRTLHALDGTPLDSTRLQQNTRAMVVLNGQSESQGLRTFILVDPLPAGWEIETVIRRGASGYGENWVGKVSGSPQLESRDDRFVAVVEQGRMTDYGEEGEATTNLGPGLSTNQFRFAYVIRAVTPGQFDRPPATVEDMYNSDIIARTDAGQTTVLPTP